MRPLFRGLLLLAVALGGMPGCGTHCDPTSSAPTGTIATDILGTWDGSGTDSRMIYAFGADGRYRWVEPPNMFAPSGLEAGGTYVVTGREVAMTQGTTTTRWWVEIDATTMKSYLSDPSGDGGTPRSQTWVRSNCSGFGF